jgi:hypothetical protein
MRARRLSPLLPRLGALGDLFFDTLYERETPARRVP